MSTVTTTALPAGTWTIDPSHSEVAFSVRHIMSKVRGQFTRFEGSLVSDGTPAGVTATGTIDLNNVDITNGGGNLVNIQGLGGGSIDLFSTGNPRSAGGRRGVECDVNDLRRIPDISASSPQADR